MKRIAFVIVNWNGADDTIACVRSLLSMDEQRFTAYVVDNGSSAEDLGRIRTALAGEQKITIIEAGDNLGYSGGNNLGGRRAIDDGIEFLIILNNDTIVQRTFLTEALHCLNEHPDIPLWGYKQFYPGLDLIYAKGGGRLNLFTGDDRLIGTRRPDDAIDDSSVNIGYVAGSCLGIDVRLMKEIGLYDDDYFLYSEEADLCIRARRHGAPIGYCSRAIVEHNAAHSTGYWSRTYVYYFLRNKFVFMRKNARWFHWPSFFVVYCFVYIGGFSLLSLIRNPGLIPIIVNAVRDAFTGRFGRAL